MEKFKYSQENKKRVLLLLHAFIKVFSLTHRGILSFMMQSYKNIFKYQIN
jgi:hypothetical protein